MSRGSGWLAMALLAAACGGKRTPAGGGDTVAAATDSLVPIADVAVPGDTLHSGVAPTSVPPPPPPPPPPAVSQPLSHPHHAAPPPARVAESPLPAAANPEPVRPADVTPAAVARHAVIGTGTPIETTAIDSIHSHVTRAGDQIHVRVAQDVSDDGHVVVPAGAVVTLIVDDIAPAPERGASPRLALSARSITIAGTTYPFDATMSDYQYELKSRGVGPSEVAKTGAGAVVGGILGRLIGGNKTGTVVGAVGGAAAGAAVAAKTVDRDVVVHAGNSITLTLRQDFAR